MADFSTFPVLDTLTGGEEALYVVGGQPYRGPTRLITPHSDHRKTRPFNGRVPVYPKLRAIDVMSDTGYTTTVPVGGSVTQIDGVKPFGTKVWRMVTGGLGVGSFAVVRKNDIGRDINITNKWIVIDLSSPNPDLINDVQVYLGNAGLTSFYKWNTVLGSQAVRPMAYGTKTRITFPLIDISQVSGTVNEATIRAWQIRVDDKGGAPCEVIIDRVAICDKPIAASVITMDDGYKSWRTLGKPLLDKYGIRSVIFAIQQYHDPSHPLWTGQPATRLTELEIEEFVEQGHELGFHLTGNHAGQDFTALEVDTECKRFKRWAVNRFGFDVMSAAYPGGEHGYFTSDPGVTVRDVISQHFPFSRTIARQFPESIPPADATIGRCYLYQYGEGASKTTPAINQGYLNNIVSKGGIGIWSFHDLVSGAATVTTQYNITEFEQNLQYIDANAIESLTLREAFARGL